MSGESPDPDGVQAGHDVVREPPADRWRPHPENETPIAVFALAGVALLLMLPHWLWELATNAASGIFDAALALTG